MGEISAASREQADGVGQVVRRCRTWTKSTQQNAALVESKAPPLRPAGAVGQLVQAVAVFQLDGPDLNPPARGGAPAHAAAIMQLRAGRVQSRAKQDTDRDGLLGKPQQ